MSPKPVNAIAIHSIPDVNPEDNIPEMILDAVRETGLELMDRDVLVIASKIVSKSEDRIVHASAIEVSKQAEKIAEKNNFDPIHVEIALREANEVINSDGVLITETHFGLVCNFSGVDKSNAPEGAYILLPENPDRSAERILSILSEKTGLQLAVIISDTQGRPWRKGSVNIAIGCAGINAYKHNKGRRDLYGRILQRSSVCQIDEIASLAEPLMGQAGERTPVVVVRGYEYSKGNEKATDINRPKSEDLFR
ncbi:MAG: coenzyme F420-0:L-glutamate ligase [Candidatus Thorarchaeota archaeon]|nr:coenzyme F420-0:L-glutamate ligase [Candidatus Thorarchaeota archaeon]